MRQGKREREIYVLKWTRGCLFVTHTAHRFASNDVFAWVFGPTKCLKCLMTMSLCCSSISVLHVPKWLDCASNCACLAKRTSQKAWAWAVLKCWCTVPKACRIHHAFPINGSCTLAAGGHGIQRLESTLWAEDSMLALNSILHSFIGMPWPSWIRSGFLISWTDAGNFIVTLWLEMPWVIPED